MSVAKRVADEMDGTFVVGLMLPSMTENSSSATWQTSWVLYPVRGHDRTRHNIPQIHD